MKILPFTAFVGLDELKEALICLAANPNIGGLLIIGPKGTGKSSIVRAFADLLPEIEVSKNCPFNCNPYDPEEMCDICRRKYNKFGKLEAVRKKMEVVNLPVGATEDMVLGTINLERTLKEGKMVFEPGLLGRANRQILYIDEVNLLPDHIADSILDAAASGMHIVEREGVSLRHPAKFILVGTMNPEEGELRPQLLDRFSISVKLTTLSDPDLRALIVKRNLEFEENPDEFKLKWRQKQAEVVEKIKRAKNLLKKVVISDELIKVVSRTCAKLEVDGYRPDIVAVKMAKALAALDGRLEIIEEDVFKGLKFALTHRTRAEGLKPPVDSKELKDVFEEELRGIVAIAPHKKKEGRKSFFRILYC